MSFKKLNNEFKFTHFFGGFIMRNVITVVRNEITQKNTNISLACTGRKLETWACRLTSD